MENQEQNNNQKKNKATSEESIQNYPGPTQNDQRI